MPFTPRSPGSGSKSNPPRPEGPGHHALELNGTDATGDIEIESGEPGQYLVVYNKLQDDIDYVAVLGAENSSRPTSFTVQFTTATGALIRYDSEGFADDTAYPLGPLQPVTRNGGTWIPAGVPALVENLQDGQFGKVLRRDQTGGNNIKPLDIAPISAGVLTIAFDARVSTPATRTLDVVLFPAEGDRKPACSGSAPTQTRSPTTTARPGWRSPISTPSGTATRWSIT